MHHCTSSRFLVTPGLQNTRNLLVLRGLQHMCWPGGGNSSADGSGCCTEALAELQGPASLGGQPTEHLLLQVCYVGPELLGDYERKLQIKCVPAGQLRPEHSSGNAAACAYLTTHLMKLRRLSILHYQQR
jgi:hypothetical protein